MAQQKTQTMELSEARMAYEGALYELESALREQVADEQVEPVVVDPSTYSWPRLLLYALLAIPIALLRGLITLAREFADMLHDARRDLKGRLVRFSQGSPAVLGGEETAQRERIRDLLLEVLWARDHVQEAIEDSNGASYENKRATLAFVMANETRLQHVGQLALDTADLAASTLREMQPTPPPSGYWWWYMNYARAKRAKRVNTFWFVMSLIPALASVVLITLLAQRLAIDGPDLLSGASIVAQVGLGVGSIIAGREILNDLILQGSRASWHGQLTFALASLFLIVVVIFYFLAPPSAAMIYNLFGQRAIDAGNAAEAELYLESAARLDPDPHAASLLEVGCLYQTLGAPDRAQVVFERVLEADSRLLLARYHLAQLYSDKGEYGKALQLLEDGLNLLDAGRNDLYNGDDSFLPNIDTLDETDDIEYLMRLARGRAYMESDAPEQAKSNLREAEDLYTIISSRPGATNATTVNQSGRTDLACGPGDDLSPFIYSTELNLHYYLARTYDELCDDKATIEAAAEEWRLVRNGRPSSSRQEAWRDEAVRLLSSGQTCDSSYGLENVLGVSGLPTRR